MADVQYLNLDRYLGKVHNRIHKVGVELEGGWSKWPTGEKFVTDSSVFRGASRAMKEVLARELVHKTGECTSPPIIPAKMKMWIKRAYPQVVDKTCGLHIHMSFGENLLYYVQLMVPEFPMTMRVYLKKWAEEENLPDDHVLWERLSGKNEYCNHMFHPDRQVTCVKKDYDHFRPGNRYTDVAYRFGTHRTIECRTLPMMESPEQGFRAAKRVLDITNAFLAKVGRRDKVDEKVIGGAKIGEEVVERKIKELELISKSTYSF